MLRITTDDWGPKVVVRVDGQLSGLGSAALERECAAAAAPVSLDLSDLSRADGEGIRVLGTLREHGVRLLNTPGYIEMLLELARGCGSKEVSAGQPENAK